MAMTTSVTRSRRAESLHVSHQKIPNGHRLITNVKSAPNKQQFTGNPTRGKRQLEASGRDFDPLVPKKARFTTGIAVEIPARPSFHPRISTERADTRSCPPPKSTVTVTGPDAPSRSRTPPAKAPKAAPARAQQRPAATKHRQKLANGLKHELDKLQPDTADAKEQGRKLRSQEATRFKSELSAYFPEYDEVIGNEPKEHHILNLSTPIVVTSGLNPPDADGSSQPHPRETYSVRSYADSLFTDLSDSQRIDFSFLNKGKSLEDPLPDSLFEPAHKKAERMERSIRNSEKGIAQHEKDQIIRLLDGLQGHDWLRIMGVSGITESRKKVFEPARQHFIKGCQAILEKFRRWAAEEKRQKRKKERAAAQAERRADREAASSEEKDREAEEADEGNSAEEGSVIDRDSEMEPDDHDDDDGDPTDADGDPPDDSDVDASVAKQLREEALAAAALKRSRSKRARGRAPPRPPPPPGLETAPETTKVFRSFFAKPHQREAALDKNRRRGRKVLAWGEPVPDVPEADFELPDEFRDEDTLKSHARRKRRDRRGRH
ncbi:hypothetical protein VTK56DRAFT_1737 [Thermocarpiscus australiensis]